MFGHDDKQHDDNNGQITLPPADSFGQDDNQQTDTTDTAKQENELNEFAQTNQRKTEKSGAPTDSLLDIKQEALQSLTPLIDHLEQSPSEKFRTTMMMIQASDNHELIKVAYEAAQHIDNERERAQALLDIVNEINYFTQQNQV